MYTKRALEKIISQVMNDLELQGWQPVKAVLFGSYAKGNPHAYSDIDLAVWASKFTGLRFDDRQSLRPLMRPYIDVEIHPFAAGDTVETNPFIEEILKDGKVVYEHGEMVSELATIISRAPVTL